MPVSVCMLRSWTTYGCLCICLFPQDITKNDTTRITKINALFVPRWVVETCLFWGHKVKGQGHESQISAGEGFFTHVSAGFFYLLLVFSRFL